MRGQHNKLTLTCGHCRAAFQKWPSQAGPFCSQACATAAAIVPLEDRFWQHVEKSDGCWLWQGQRGSGGYGKISGLLLGRPRRHYRAHRVAYELTYGPIPDGDLVRHFICDNPPCVRPDHLRLGSPADNSADCVSANRTARGDAHGSRILPERVLRGTSHPKAKLDDEAVQAIIAARNVGESLGKIGNRYGVSKQTISRVVRGETWRHVICSPSPYDS